MRLHSIVLVLSLFAGFTGCDAYYDFEVTVVSEDGQPVEGASVYLLGRLESTELQPETTDDAGRAHYYTVYGSSMTTRLVVFKHGYLPIVEKEQTFRPGKHEIEVNLEKYVGEKSEQADQADTVQENPMNSVDSKE